MKNCFDSIGNLWTGGRQLFVIFRCCVHSLLHIYTHKHLLIYCFSVDLLLIFLPLLTYVFGL